MLSVLGGVLSLFAIYWVFQPMSAQQYRPIFLSVALLLTFMVFRGGQRRNRADHPEENPTAGDWALGIAAAVSVGYAGATADELFRRAAAPETLDIVMGIAAMLLILEATRRTVGWILPAIVLGFVAYAYLGGLIPDSLGLAHKGYGVDRIVGQGYMGLEGVFGIPLDVAATYIVLFTIYGAVLEYSGAARFFVEISYAAFGRSRTGPGRTTTLAGFLLGTVSGSGVATTVTLGSVTWPLLRRAGYPKNEGGGVLAAAGIGAILSPPTLGAAAFIIAEFLEISYLQVLVYALVPTFLYYLGILLAIEADTRRFEVEGLDMDDARLLAAARALGLPLLVADPDRDPAGAELLAVPRRRVRDRAGVPALVPGQARPDGPAQGLGRARGRRARRAADRRHHRGGGHHRRGRLAHRPRPGAVLADRRRRGRLAGADRGVRRDRRADRRPRGARHRVVHHRRGDHRARRWSRSGSRTTPRTCSSSTTPC